VPTQFERDLTLIVERAAPLSGFLLWIELETIDGSRLNSLTDLTSWLPVYCPVFEHEPVVAPGTVVRMACRSRLSDNGVNPDYFIEGQLTTTDGNSLRFSFESPHHRPAEFGPFHQRWIPRGIPQRGRSPELASDLRSHLGRQLPAYLIPSQFVLLDRLPRTPGGKVDVQALLAAQQPPLPPARGPVAPRNETEQLLADIWSAVLKLPRVGVEDNFFELGGDSILALQIVSRARRSNLHVTLEQLFRTPTVSGLAAVASPIRASQAEQGMVTGKLPLTPIQRWFFEQPFPQLNHYNQAMWLELSPQIHPRILEPAIRLLVTHHDAMRLRFHKDQTGWEQEIAPSEPNDLVRHVDLSQSHLTEQDELLESHAAALHAGLDLEKGPLIRAAFFNLGPLRPPRLFLVIHHLAVDGVSWRILLEDLESICRQLGSGQQVELPPKSHSFKAWSTRLRAVASDVTTTGELPFWLSLPWPAVRPLPLDHSHGQNIEASAASVSIRLDVAQTESLLRRVPKTHHAQINDVLLTALVSALAQWAGTPHLLIDLEGHGREPLFDGVDVSRTVGWFTTVYPALFEYVPSLSPRDLLSHVRQQLGKVPRRGLGFGLLRYGDPGSRAAQELAALPRAQVSFNYFGQVDAGTEPAALLRPLWEPTGPARDPAAPRSHLIEINALVRDERLEVEWTYSTNFHGAATIQRLAETYRAALLALSDDAGRNAAMAPADFPLAGLNRRQLERILGRAGKATGPHRSSSWPT
jgi:non-ribosomal peptide synthase protein (TIGR01720 family)